MPLSAEGEGDFTRPRLRTGSSQSHVAGAAEDGNIRVASLAVGTVCLPERLRGAERCEWPCHRPSSPLLGVVNTVNAGGY